MVRASYEEIMEPTLEHCMKWNLSFQEIQRRTGVNGFKRAVFIIAN